MHALIVATLLVSVAFTGCLAGEGEDRRHDPGPRGRERADDPPPEPGCRRSLEELLALEYETPEWEEVHCLAKDLERLPKPAFAKRAGLPSDATRDGPLAGQTLWTRVLQDMGLNVSPAFASALPPYAWPEGPDLAYPLDDRSLDFKLRGALPWFIAEKQAGRPIHVQFQYPPGKAVPIWPDAAAFRAWVDGTFVPLKIAEAKAVETIRAEYWDPFPIETGIVWFASWPGVEGLGERINLSEQVELMQYALDRTRDAVRPHFHGVLKAQFAARFDQGDTTWTNLSFAGWDEVAVTFYPSCDLPSTERYLEAHLAAIRTIVDRDGVDWTLGETDVERRVYEACGTDFEAIEPQAIQAILDAIDRAPVAPVGANLYYATATAEAFAIQKDWLAAR